MQGYVNVVVLSKNLIKVLVLLKLHGPAFLKGKYNFPGGKIEEGETPAQAASRELKEEAGVDIPAESLIFVSHKVFGGDSELYTFCAVSNEALKAQTLTDERIELFYVDTLMGNVIRAPNQYCPDFLSLLAASIEAYHATEAKS